MKTLQSNGTVWALALLLSGSTLMACAQATSTGTTSTTPSGGRVASTSQTALVAPLRQMVTKLQRLQPTGDPDFDFAMQAKIHAQGEQDLLKQAAQTNEDSALKSMTTALLTDVQSDITQVDGIMRQIKPARPNQAYTQQQSRNVEAMNLKIQQATTGDRLAATGDQYIIGLLLDHRQDAVDMASTYLQYGRNASLRTYAQELVDSAKKEMEQLKGLKK
ncbi:DUF305 domain-containing protein [Spirosoma montaniterrae]|uniref:DUF305 domain-containing protein n=1 Tax=Spirosoma montaniterrae TaxID=1178516 RepID=A0A1P9WYR1_9BACT|nr:DUF305 domain-containing protein [Spirosoma montaniterrae]AQG80515.1 DUF305 domain-containing protein [Spirosoma montaniterrae]